MWKRLAVPSVAAIQWRPLLITAALFYGVIELGAFGVLLYYRHVDPSYFAKSPSVLAASVRDQDIANFNRWLADPLLGWDFRPGYQLTWEGTVHIGADGARYDPAFPDAPPDIDVYGASFVVCDQVDDDESWEHYLSLGLRRHVANFGGFGYAPDQALLKYKFRHAARRPRVAVLAITPDELARVFNRYKQFFDSGLVSIGFKPRFVLDGGELKLIRQPADGTAVSRDNLPALIEAAAAGDAWRARQVDFAWPYVLRVMQIAPVAIADTFEIEIPSLGIIPRDLWRTTSATRLMRALIDDFVATATSRGAAPVILFIPTAPKPGEAPPYEDFVKQLRRDLRPQVALVVDVDEGDFVRERYNMKPFIGHASPYGNQAIARHLASVLPLWLDCRAGCASR